MKLSHLSDQTLLHNTFLLVKKEKEILSEILSHLQEVQRRRLFCELGHGSLFEYCVKQLGYSEDQSYRRINALKLMREIPEIQTQIEKGELNLSSLTVAQSLFKADATVDKKEVLAALKNKTKREAEKVVRSFSPKMPERRMFTFALTQEQESKWNAVKAKLAHCNLKDEEILERLCDLFLAPKPAPKAKSQSNSKLTPKTTPNSAPRPAPSKSSASPTNAKPASISTQKATGAPTTKSIPAATKRQVFTRDQNRCTNCNGVYALEIDHKIPLALGGTHHLSNLRILCRSCNQRAAIRNLGAEKMEKFLGT